MCFGMALSLTRWDVEKHRYILEEEREKIDTKALPKKPTLCYTLLEILKEPAIQCGNEMQDKTVWHKNLESEFCRKQMGKVRTDWEGEGKLLTEGETVWTLKCERDPFFYWYLGSPILLMIYASQFCISGSTLWREIKIICFQGIFRKKCLVTCKINKNPLFIWLKEKTTSYTKHQYFVPFFL